MNDLTALYQARCDRIAQGVPDDLACLIFDAEMDHASKAEDLKLAACQMITKMERLLESLDNGYQVNSLDVVQGSGSQLDVLCSEYMATAAAVKKITAVVQKMVG